MRKLKIPRTPLGPFETDDYGPYFEIPLTQGMHAKVSPEDAPIIGAHCWYASHESRRTKFYAVRWTTMNGKRVKLRMHREIMGLPTGDIDSLVVDHLPPHHDSLDNRRSRLEVITQDENMRRSKGWKKKPEEPSL